jgi:hypothetical protein
MWLGIGFVAAIVAARAHAHVGSAADARAARETVSRYCTGCHNERARVAGLVLNPAGIAEDPVIWEKVVRKLRMRTMRPAGSPRPDGATYSRVTAARNASGPYRGGGAESGSAVAAPAESNRIRERY